MTSMSEILEQLRSAIETSPKTRYRLWQETRIEQSQLSRFMAGTSSLGIEHIEKLAKALDLELSLHRRKKTKKKR